MGTLFIIPTPVGNLEDITLRAINILKSVDTIYAEDTRTSAFLLKKYDIHTHMESHHKFNEHQNCSQICDKILTGRDVAVISDAGTPGISDPGFLLVRACIQHNITVITLPGATAFVPALIDSGLPSDSFVFDGFLPVKKGRQTKLKELSEEGRTMIFYESPFRLAKTLSQMGEFFGLDRRASVSREISKIHEDTRRGTLGELSEWYTLNQPKGEIVLIVEGRDYVGKGKNI